MLQFQPVFQKFIFSEQLLLAGSRHDIRLDVFVPDGQRQITGLLPKLANLVAAQYSVLGLEVLEGFVGQLQVLLHFAEGRVALFVIRIVSFRQVLDFEVLLANMGLLIFDFLDQLFVVFKVPLGLTPELLHQVAFMDKLVLQLFHLGGACLRHACIFGWFGLLDQRHLGLPRHNLRLDLNWHLLAHVRLEILAHVILRLNFSFNVSDEVMGIDALAATGIVNHELACINLLQFNRLLLLHLADQILLTEILLPGLLEVHLELEVLA